MSLMTSEQAVQWLRDQPDQQKLVAACYFDDPLMGAAERFWQSSEWKAIAALMPKKQGQALDLGAGRGISSYAMAKDGWKVTALEPDQSTLIGAGAIRALSKQSKIDITVVNEYSEKLPFEDNRFDIVNCRQVLHHTRDLSQSCREIYRVLKPGGMMIATREHVISKHEDLQDFLNAHTLHKYVGGENAFLLEEYLSAIQLSGLQLKHVLAPLDSPINYFPMTSAEHFNYCSRPVARIIGQRLAKILLSTQHFLGKFLMKKIVTGFNQKDHTPGRLYSFVASKPPLDRP